MSFPTESSDPGIAVEPMKVLYDISSLGSAWASRQGLTGVARVIEQVLASLLMVPSEQCHLFPCAPTSPAVARAVFERDFPSFKDRLPTSSIQRWPGSWIGATERMLAASMPRRGLAWRALRGTLLPLIHRRQSKFGKMTEAEFARADVYHSPHGSIPSWVQAARDRTNRPQVVLTVYDLIPFRHPEFFRPGMADAQRAILRTTNPKQDWYICISECTKRDLCELFDVAPERVFVTPLAADPKVFYPGEKTAVREIGGRYGLTPDAPYLMSLCTLEPRKNVQTIVKGFAEIVRSGAMPDLQLLLAGGRGWLDEDLQATLARWPEVRRRIILPGYVPDEDLAPLYSGALCFAYLSRYEGFGLPPLEAMQCGAPVLVSNTSSLPEVVGDAGLTFDPDDVDGFAQAVVGLAGDPAQQANMAAGSLARAAQFSWTRCAQDTLAAYRALRTNRAG